MKALSVTKERTSTPGVRKVTRVYPGNRKRITYEVYVKVDGKVTHVGVYDYRSDADSVSRAARKINGGKEPSDRTLKVLSDILNKRRYQ